MPALLTTSWFQVNRALKDFSTCKVPYFKKQSSSIIVRAPAKINLYLKIHEKLKNNYHNIETIYGAITLYDTIIIYKSEKPPTTLYSNIKQFLKTNNTVIKVIKYLSQKYSLKKIWLKIYLQKNIPIGAGLGGESSDAVFTYFAFHKLFNIHLEYKEATDELKRFGTDTLYFLYGGIAYGKGLPDTITPVNLNKFIKNKGLYYPFSKFSTNNMYILLLYPHIKKNTKIMYEEYDKHRQEIKESNNLLHNDFKSILCHKYKKIKILLDIIYSLGYEQMCNISGSGSIIYILVKSYKEVMDIWNSITAKSRFKISGACARFTGKWKNIFFL